MSTGTEKYGRKSDEYNVFHIYLVIISDYLPPETGAGGVVPGSTHGDGVGVAIGVGRLISIHEPGPTTDGGVVIVGFGVCVTHGCVMILFGAGVGFGTFGVGGGVPGGATGGLTGGVHGVGAGVPGVFHGSVVGGFGSSGASDFHLLMTPKPALITDTLSPATVLPCHTKSSV